MEGIEDLRGSTVSKLCVREDFRDWFSDGLMHKDMYPG